MSGCNQDSKNREGNSKSVDFSSIDYDQNKISDKTQYSLYEQFTDRFENIVEGILNEDRYTIDEDGNIGIDLTNMEGYHNQNFKKWDCNIIEFINDASNANIKNIFGHILYEFSRHFESVDYDSVVYIDDFDDDIDFVDFADISSEHASEDHHENGEVIRTEVQIQDTSESTICKLDSTWKCQADHITNKKEYRWSNKMHTPASCDHQDCRCKPTSRMKNMSSNTIDIRRVILTETNKDDKQSRSLVADLDKPHIDDVDRRDKYEVIANVYIADRKNKSTSKPYLDIIAKKPIGKDVELTEDKKTEMDKIAEKYDYDDLVEKLAESVAPEIMNKDGQKNGKLAVLLSAVRGAGYTKRDMIHTLLFGKPGSGKSRIMEYMDMILTDSKFADVQNASEAGLTGIAQRTSKLGDDDSWMVVGGSIPQAHGSVCFIDELDKSDLSEEVLGKPMNSGKVIINKAGDADLKAETSIVATANPDDMEYGDNLSKLDSLDVSRHIQDRMDLKVRVDDKIEDRDSEEDMLDNISLVDDDDEDNEEEAEFDLDEMREWVAYSQQKDIEWSTEADELVQDKMLDMRMTFKDIENPDLQVSNREPRKFQRICSAMTKLRLGDVVQEHDVERAWDLYVNCWKSVSSGIDIERNYN